MATKASDGSAVDWLLDGDPAIRWQVLKDLRKTPARAWRAERRRVGTEGWGARLLSLRRPDGHWGEAAYRPKWTCTTYTLLLLRRLGLEPGHPVARDACRRLLDEGLLPDRGVNFAGKAKRGETCITGMVLGLATGFGLEDPRVEALVGFLLDERMSDGGWNCRRAGGATHSSFHTTLSVLEALRAYAEGGGPRAKETAAAEAGAREFLLAHRLYKSHRTGEVVDPKMTRLAFPPQWRYDVLRGLEYFATCGAPRDARLEDGIDLLLSKRAEDGSWPLEALHAGKLHFVLERVGAPSRWNTLRALRVLRWWGGGRGGRAR
ncbi:MAG: hypothetical protein HYZ53_04400 [Planctomycetes bacterium]|nr:hypothetical protein [Planctomycetota bacterium]